MAKKNKESHRTLKYYYKQTPEQRHLRHLKETFKLTKETYQALLDKQDGVCGIFVGSPKLKFNLIRLEIYRSIMTIALIKLEAYSVINAIER